jgi:hypothetical protein
MTAIKTRSQRKPHKQATRHRQVSIRFPRAAKRAAVAAQAKVARLVKIAKTVKAVIKSAQAAKRPVSRTATRGKTAAKSTTKERRPKAKSSQPSTLRRPQKPQLPVHLRKEDDIYCAAFGGAQLEWLPRAVASKVGVVLGEATSGGLHSSRAPLLSVSVSQQLKTVSISKRSAETLGLRIASARGPAAGKDRKDYLIVPIRIYGDELHANILIIDMRGTVVRIYLYEPHGWAVQNGFLQDDCGFTNFYNGKQYEASMKEYLKAACEKYAGLRSDHWQFVPPSQFEEAAGPQTTSDVRGPAMGDPWCAFHTTWFALEAVKTSPEDFLLKYKQAAHAGKQKDLVVKSLNKLATAITNGLKWR